MRLNLNVAGFDQDLEIPDDEFKSRYRPLVEAILKLDDGSDGRKIVFLAGPPGCGKSTLAAAVGALAGGLYHKTVTVLPMDGFHFPNAYLDAHGLRHRKGAPESYDRVRFADALRRLHQGEKLAWPVYDRNIHDPVPDAVPVPPKGIFIVEGNYLLLDEPGWRELGHLADLKVFIMGVEEALVDRLIGRHVRGGKTPDQARDWVNRLDRENIRRVLASRRTPDREF